MENFMRKKLYMLVGLPASGKSTWVENFMKDKNPDEWVVISSDRYIEEKAKEEGKTYAQVFTKYVKEATKDVRRQIYDARRDYKNVIWDQTNLNADRRKNNIDEHYLRVYELIAVWFKEPANLEERLNSREGKSIPPQVIADMRTRMSKPSLSEGFDKIIEADNE